MMGEHYFNYSISANGNAKEAEIIKALQEIGIQDIAVEITVDMPAYLEALSEKECGGLASHCKTWADDNLSDETDLRVAIQKSCTSDIPKKLATDIYTALLNTMRNECGASSLTVRAIEANMN